MYVEVAAATDDIKPDSSAMSPLELPVYFSDLKNCTAVDEWEHLPSTKVGETVLTAWGTLGVRLRCGEGLNVHREQAFLNTGPEPIVHLAFSPAFNDGSSEYGAPKLKSEEEFPEASDSDTEEVTAAEVGGYVLLTVVKYASFGAMAARSVNPTESSPAILQHWLMSCAEDAVAPVLISRLQILSGAPRSLGWYDCSWKNSALLGYVSADNKFRLCLVRLGVTPAAIVQREVCCLAEEEYASFDIIRKEMSATDYRIALGSSSGYVFMYDVRLENDRAKIHIISRACYFIDPQPVTSVKFMTQMSGYVFVAGVSTGRIRVCDIRLSGGAGLFHVDYMTRPVYSLAWPIEYGAVVAVQNDGLIIPLTGAETSRHHFSRGWPSKTPTAHSEDLTPFQKYWSDILCPRFRSIECIKAFDIPAVACAVSQGDVAFSFDAGVALSGVIAQFDMKAYLQASLFTWNFVPAIADHAEAAQVKMEDPGEVLAVVAKNSSGLEVTPKVEEYSANAMTLLQESKTIIEGFLSKAVQTACERGLHILKSGYFDFETTLSGFWREGSLVEDGVTDFIDSITALSLPAAAGCKEHRVFAYGSQLGLVHVHQPNGSRKLS